MDHVVDTNVLLVASAAHPYSPFDDSHVPRKEQMKVLDWLSAFRADPDRRLVLDDLFKIYNEYRNKLTDQDYGLLVVHEKMNSLRSVGVSWDGSGYAVVPPQFASFDPSDRKLLAAALADPETIDIVNAADSDWLKIEPALAATGVRVHHIIELWLRATHDARP
jgi:hypothetical protein